MLQLKIDSQLDHSVSWLPHAKNYTTAKIKESKQNRKPLDHEEQGDYFKNSNNEGSTKKSVLTDS